MRAFQYTIAIMLVLVEDERAEMLAYYETIGVGTGAGMIEAEEGACMGSGGEDKVKP